MGSVFSMIGDVNQSNADVQRAQMQGQQGDTNRTLLDMSANSVLDKGSYQAGVIGIRGSQAIGRQQAGYASSGVDLQSGSALDAAGTTRMLSNQDQNMMMANAARSAWGLKVKGQQSYLQGIDAALGSANDAQNATWKGFGDATNFATQLFSFGMKSGGGEAPAAVNSAPASASGDWSLGGGSTGVA